MNLNLGADLALRKKPNTVTRLTGRQTSRFQGRNVHGLRSVKPPGLNSLLYTTDIHLIELLREDVVKTPLRQPPEERHLTAFKTVNGDTAPGFLTLVALAAGLAQARTRPAPDPLARVGGAFIVSKFVQSHGTHP
jgi:hypothetical protein